jgi:energy-coupling factor transporter transmembrane protein EcfT
MRFLKRIFPLKLLLPILVSASRFAFSVGLSMESRGLNKHKTFSELHRWRKFDTLVLLGNLLQILILVGIFVLLGKFSVRLV